MSKANIGSGFEDFLREEGRLEQATAVALKRVIAWQIQQAMNEERVSKTVLARRMGTSRAQVDRLLDANNPAGTLDTITRAAAALGRRINIGFECAA